MADSDKLLLLTRPEHLTAINNVGNLTTTHQDEQAKSPVSGHEAGREVSIQPSTCVPQNTQDYLLWCDLQP